MNNDPSNSLDTISKTASLIYQFFSRSSLLSVEEICIPIQGGVVERPGFPSAHSLEGQAERTSHESWTCCAPYGLPYSIEA
eukprot:1139477-Pelagomonas_calceolata.AAC.3